MVTQKRSFVPKTINPIKKAKVKKALIEGKSARAALREANYTKASVSHSTGMGVVKCSMKEIKRDLKESDITVEYVINNLKEDRELATRKGDLSTAARVDELLGKVIAMFKDKVEQTVELNVLSEARKLRETYSVN